MAHSFTASARRLGITSAVASVVVTAAYTIILGIGLARLPSAANGCASSGPFREHQEKLTRIHSRTVMTLSLVRRAG